MTRQAEINKARKIDTKVAELWAAYYNVADQASTRVKEANRIEKSLPQYRHMSAASAERMTARMEKLRAEADALMVQAKPLRDEAEAFDKANYEGWNRFFFVKHIHNTAHCSSFRPTTRVGWLPQVSGLTEAEAVAEHGATLCTICFPSAPTELTQAKEADDICKGHADRNAPSRRGYYSGNWATCSDCGQRVTLTKTGMLRKHKKQA